MPRLAAFAVLAATLPFTWVRVLDVTPGFPQVTSTGWDELARQTPVAFFRSGRAAKTPPAAPARSRV